MNGCCYRLSQKLCPGGKICILDAQEIREHVRVLPLKAMEPQDQAGIW